jgi:ATP/maltotriose-dependent transcriptional regulator MalT
VQAADPRETRPRRPQVWTSRRRVVDAIAHGAGTNAVVFVYGPAGSGKTLAVDEFARHDGGRPRWLNLQRGPREFADYLAGAEPDDLVIADGLDALDRRAQEEFAESVRRLPSGVRAVVTSRFAPPPGMARERLDGRVCVIDPEVLALESAEAVELGAALGTIATS